MKYSTSAIAAAAIAILFFFFGYHTRKSIEICPTISEHIDTVWEYKTSVAPPSAPVSVESSNRDVIIPAPDVNVLDDNSVAVVADIVEYRDTLPDGTSYVARISGIQPKLEYLSYTVLSPTITKTRTERKTYEGWLLSLTSSGIVSQSPNWFCQSTAALELSYNTGPFHIGLQGGVLARKEFSREASIGVSPYLGCHIAIDIFRLGR